jgi:hypothetical protein
MKIKDESNCLDYFLIRSIKNFKESIDNTFTL